MAISSKESQSLIAVLAWLKKNLADSAGLSSFPTYVSGEISASVRIRVSGGDIEAEVGSHEVSAEISQLRSYQTYAHVNKYHNRLVIQGSGGSFEAIDYNDQGTRYSVSVSSSTVTVGNNSFRLS